MEIFREATIDDLPDLIKLFKSTIFHTKHRVDTYFRNHINNNNVILLYDNDIMIGAYVMEITRLENTMTLRRGKNKSLWLQQIMVFPKYQHKGYGHRLMHHFMEQSDTLPMRLECNNNLMLYYMQFGFETIERCLYGNPKEVINIMYLRPTKHL